MSASEEVDAVATFEGTPFEVIGHLKGAHADIIAATRETAEALVDRLQAEGGLDHDDVAPPARSIYRLGGRMLNVGRKPNVPMDASTFYWIDVVPTVRTHPSVRLDGWTLDADQALAGSALAARLEEATLSGSQPDRLRGYVRDCQEYLRSADAPATAYELHDHARSVPSSPGNAEGHESALEILATLPGVDAPDPDTPSWVYQPEA